MNPYLSPDTVRSEVPSVILAKLDFVEPINSDGDTVFSFEGIDADWKELRAGGLLDLSARPDRRWYARNGSDAVKWELIARAPLHRMEFTLIGPAAYRMRRLGRGWLAFRRDPRGTIGAEVYSGLFAAAAPAKFAWPKRVPGSRTLQMCFSLAGHPNATSRDLRRALRSTATPMELAVHDVGQGSASAVLDADGQPILYFDFGCGVHGNAATRPANIGFCLCGSPPIVLSHWDADHWAAATIDTAALSMTWIAPRQVLGPHQAALAANVLLNGGSLLILPSTRSPRLYWVTVGRARLFVQRGTGSDKNGSGIVLVVRRDPSKAMWLLMGDVDYSQLAFHPPDPLVAAIVPHHGADMGGSSLAPTPTTGYRRLAYSFGPGNKHGSTAVTHPTPAAVARHVAAGWGHGAWTTSGGPPGTAIAGGDVLATASSPVNHLGGLLIGWTAPPSPRGACTVCSSMMTMPQS
jgi:hypothetical protein